MKKWLLLALSIFSMCLQAQEFSDDVVGFWKSVDEKTGKPQSVVAVYPHDGKYYGRLIVTFDEDGSIQDSIEKPGKRAPGVAGNPHYAGLDFIWDLAKSASGKLTGGEILDPQEGKIYGAKMWRDGDNLIVRGEILFLGRNQTWPRAQESDFPPGFTKPDLTNMKPRIPQVKE